MNDDRNGQRGVPGPVALLAVVHALVYLLVHRGGVLGQVPVLDGRELLELAWQWGHQGPGPEPFYRAPLYPLLLSLPVRAGLPAELLMPVAQFFNALCHGANAALVAAMAGQLWGHRNAAWIAGGIYAAYPVAVFFSGEPLDVTPAITLALLGIHAWLRAGDAPPAGALRWAAVSAVSLVAAFLARPQFLALVPLLVIASPRALSARRARVGFPALLVAAFLAVGAGNAWRTGEFRILPTQGGYNLWAANGPEANGRFFVQTRAVFAAPGSGNPNRVEGQRRFRDDHGLAADQPVDDGEVSRYWSRRTLDYVADHPLAWLRLEAVKLAALLHDHEQYNNKTYALHKSLNPVLAWNPLSWLVLVILAVLGVGAAARPGKAWRMLVPLAGYAAGLMATYVSGRFRLPLAPMLCVLAGGLAGAGGLVRLRRRAAAVLPVLAVLALAGLWPHAWARPEATAAEDWLLTASAASRIGRDEEALRAIDRARALRPGDPKIPNLLCSIGFNTLINRLGESAAAAAPAGLREACRADAVYSRGSRWAHGVLAWRSGAVDTALAEWQALLDGGDDGATQRALAALVMTGRATPGQRRRLLAVPVAEREGLALFAAESLGEEAARRQLAARYPPDWLKRQRTLYARLFSSRQTGPSDEEPDG